MITEVKTFIGCIYLRIRSTKWVRIDLVDCTDLVDFLVVTGKVYYPGTSLYFYSASLFGGSNGSRDETMSVGAILPEIPTFKAIIIRLLDWIVVKS